MKKVVKATLGVVVAGVVLFLVAVGAGNVRHNREVRARVAHATAQVAIEVPATVSWKGMIGGVEQAGQGAMTLDVPDTGTGGERVFNVDVQKTSPGNDVITVILSVDGKERTRRSTDNTGSSIRVEARRSVQ